MGARCSRFGEVRPAKATTIVQESIHQINPITVAVDAMGGDQAPRAVITGAVNAARALPMVRLLLVGDTAVLQPLLDANAPTPTNITLHHASQVVEMCDAPSAAIKQKRDSSIAVGMRLVRDGAAHAIISAGNSGAMMAAAMLILKAQPGVDRPAIATFLPTKKGRVILLDAGATTDCKPSNLLQFAHLGSNYAAWVFECPTPRIGLLSIGEEPSKGNELTKETHQLLLTSGLNFVGNVEPKELVQGVVDVVVCDGFVGNLMLKAGEGFCETVLSLVKAQFSQGWRNQLLGKLVTPMLRRVVKLVDYAEYGGALLLGTNGVVVISHGRSNALAIQNAIRVAARAAEHRPIAPLLLAEEPQVVST